MLAVIHIVTFGMKILYLYSLTCMTRKPKVMNMCNHEFFLSSDSALQSISVNQVVLKWNYRQKHFSFILQVNPTLTQSPLDYHS